MEPTKLQDVVKGLRVETDALIQKVGFLADYPTEQREKTETSPAGEVTCAREAEIALVKLQEAKMWLGKCLESIGTHLPAQYADKADLSIKQ